MLSFSFGPARAPDLKARVVIDGEGRAEAQGVITAGGERSGVLVALRGAAQASCADVDGDGVGGLTALTIEFGERHGDDRLLVTVVPDRGEIDEDGWHPASIGIGDSTVAGRMMVSGFAGRAGQG